MKALAFLLFLSPIGSLGQSTQKIGVKFSCTCNDTVGARYATAVRDLIAVSPRYKLVGDFVEGSKSARVFNMGIRVVSLDPQGGSPGNGTALATVITWGYLYATNTLQICTSEAVQTCAANTIATLDSEVAIIQESTSENLNTKKNASPPAYIPPERTYEPNPSAKQP